MKITISECSTCGKKQDVALMRDTNVGYICNECYEKRIKYDTEITTLIDIILDRYGVPSVDRANLLRMYADKFQEKYGERHCFTMYVGDTGGELH